MHEEILRRTIHDMILNQCRLIVKFWLKQHSRTTSSHEYFCRCFESVYQLLYGFQLQENTVKVYDKITGIYDLNYTKSVWDCGFFTDDFEDVDNKRAIQMIDILGGNLYDWFITSFLEKGI